MGGEKALVVAMYLNCWDIDEANTFARKHTTWFLLIWTSHFSSETISHKPSTNVLETVNAVITVFVVNFP